LLGIARSFQKELDQIAEKADTSTPAGLGYVLTGKSKLYILLPFTISVLWCCTEVAESMKCSYTYTELVLHSREREK
jgi:uncharacterized membrane protein